MGNNNSNRDGQAMLAGMARLNTSTVDLQSPISVLAQINVE